MKQTKRVLSVVLALAMVFAMSIMVSAATPQCKTEMEKSADGKTITVKLLGTGENLATFDYGVAFDSKQLEVVNSADDEAVTWGDRMLKCAMKTCNNQGNYVVLGGTHSGDTFKVDAGDLIASVTFKAIGDSVDASSIVVLNDTAAVVGDKEPSSLTVDDFKATTADGVKVEETPVESIPTPAPEATPTPEAPADNNGAADNNNSNAAADNNNNNAAAPAASTAPAASQAPAKAPKTADTASVVIPVVAIVAAAAAVVVVSKKRVEE